MNEKKERKGKKILLSCIAVALVAAISVGTTLALSHATATVKENTFTTPNISLALVEETWDGDTDGDGTPDATVGELGITAFGKEQASGYASGAVINKDPKLVNTSAYGEYVALKLEYYVNGTLVDPASFKANVGSFTVDTAWTTDTTWNNTNAGKELYYYGSGAAFTILGATESTADLFQTIKVEAGDSGSVTTVAGTPLSWSQMPEFEIKVKGCAIQSDNLTDVDTIKAELQKLI